MSKQRAIGAMLPKRGQAPFETAVGPEYGSSDACKIYRGRDA